MSSTWARNVIHRINPKISDIFRSFQPREVVKMKTPKEKGVYHQNSASERLHTLHTFWKPFIPSPLSNPTNQTK